MPDVALQTKIKTRRLGSEHCASNHFTIRAMNSGVYTPRSVQTTFSPADGLRTRGQHDSAAPRVHFARQAPPLQTSNSFRQRLRIQQFQRRWENIKEDLPPQLTRRHSTSRITRTSLTMIMSTCSRNDIHRRCDRYRTVRGLWCCFEERWTGWRVFWLRHHRQHRVFLVRLNW